MIRRDNRNLAMQFIILMGFVSLFGDITYEGARSITGPYLGVLGASAAMVGLIAGIGEFLGYALRMLSGFIADRTRAYWPLTFLGYGLMFSIPLLALTRHWQLAAVFIILERVGKAVRSPARDTILSYATKQVGRGWGFGVHEAMDQIGAVLGPLVFTAVFILKGGYKQGFTALWVPAALTIAVLLIAVKKVPLPQKLEEEQVPAVGEDKNIGKLPPIFWFYTLFTFLCVAGFANFALIGFHFGAKGVVPIAQIPLFYCLAMAVDGIAALVIGKAYDKIGLKSLILLPLLTLPIPFLAFSQNYYFALASVVLWGAAMGIHETIMRAAIADMTHIKKRGFAYGVFNTAYGLAWFVGSAAMGLLYGVSIAYICVFVIIMELISLPVFFMVKKTNDREAIR
ncbi:MAG: MFS transporter [Candidatus Omnitrophica bacterium CG1_02_44_16]|nr:MAG: MFS transporter [Candidatus Omnitrophica bacterium CG1_02_44_16]PIY82780.1 MAG: MFS transporter [Candidatus Omnitrophica bacterium CG_4_10_14_0_8_um_filter_44_12]PIZ83236.1 MAG: MFS transporter [Candidatus Omnitrophica bacterium CG_4_10_14_0_2_um_filter_44_9]